MRLAQRQTIRLGTICRLRASVFKTKNPITENEVETLKKENPTFRGVFGCIELQKKERYTSYQLTQLAFSPARIDLTYLLSISN
jgi:hypothetical protein